MRLLALVGKELRTFARDPALLFVVFFLFVVHPYQSAKEAAPPVSNYPVAIYDLDRSQTSAAFVESLRPPYFAVRQRIEREGAITTLLDRDEVSMVVVIPEGFSRRIHRGQPAAVQVITDGTYSLTGQRAGAYMLAVARRFAEEQQHVPGHHATLPVVDARVRVRYNPALVEAWPPALDMLFMAVILVALLLPAAFMVREKEQGTVEQLLVSPVRPWEVVAAKILPMVFLTVLVTLASLEVLVWAIDLPVRGSLLFFLTATALAAFSMGGISLVLATMVRTLPSAMILVFTLVIPIQFLSGSITPVEAMPAWQYYLTLASPQRYYLNLAYGILLKGAPFAALWRDVAGLALVGGILFILGSWRFRRQFG